MWKEDESDDMNVEDLLEQMIYERIETLLNGRSNGATFEEKRLNDRIAEFFGRLDKEWKADIEQSWNDWIIPSAEDSRYLYLAGIKDGIRIYKMISGK